MSDWGTCIVGGCHKAAEGRSGWCRMHASRARRHGSVEVVKRPPGQPGAANPNWSETPSYNAMHLRLRSARGPARGKACVDCGGPARHWTYDHADPDEIVAKEGAYSLSLEHYAPRCVSCHKHLDLRVIREHL